MMKKKLLMLLLAGCMACSMTACGDKEETTEKTETETSAPELDLSALGTSTLTALGDYMELSYVPMDASVTEEEVEAEVQYLLESAPVKTPQETASETSVVNIDYEGKKDGVAFEGGTAKGYELDLGNSNFIEGFAESIVGMKVGETKDCPMTFPEDYHAEDLAGAEVVFTITVNDCWEESLAELNDEFAVSQGYDSVDAMYADIREQYESSRAQEARANASNQLLSKVIENSTFEVKEEEIAVYVGDITAQYENMASYYGYDLETYLSMAGGMSMSDFEELARQTAIYRIQSLLAANAILEAEGLELTDEIYAEKTAEYAKYYGYESGEAFEAAYTKNNVQAQIITDLVSDFLIENAVAEEAAEE